MAQLIINWLSYIIWTEAISYKLNFLSKTLVGMCVCIHDQFEQFYGFPLYIHMYIHTYILCSGKVWQGGSLVNLVNSSWFAKLKPSKLVFTINNLLADLLIRQTFFRQMFFCQMLKKRVNLPNFPPLQTFPLLDILEANAKPRLK